jgi:hypothetical protein
VASLRMRSGGDPHGMAAFIWTIAAASRLAKLPTHEAFSLLSIGWPTGVYLPPQPIDEAVLGGAYSGIQTGLPAFICARGPAMTDSETTQALGSRLTRPEGTSGTARATTAQRGKAPRKSAQGSLQATCHLPRFRTHHNPCGAPEQLSPQRYKRAGSPKEPS